MGTGLANEGTSSTSVLAIAAIGYNVAAGQQGLPQSAETILGLKVLMIGFPMIAAVGSWSSFKFIWNINADVRAKIAAWKEEKAAKVAAATSAE